MNRRFLLAVIGTGVMTGVAAAGDAELPAVSHDGLELRPGQGAAVVYVRPGVDFSRYKRIAILECPVAFSKDWEKGSSRGTQRVSPKDMEKIKGALSAEFLEIFTDELQNKGGYEIVTTGAEDVLVLRPAIIDLVVTAPASMNAGRSYTLSESAGAMTLYLEVFDSVTNQLLARAIDRKAGRGTGTIRWQNSVTNKAEADRVLRRWAGALRARLDDVHGRKK
ncbi:MAG: DUF3313 family protein [Gammaproteobacteria bacterium]|nr:DUF3313 family protein [Gammaproteobacteria bacterium]